MGRKVGLTLQMQQLSTLGLPCAGRTGVCYCQIRCQSGGRSLVGLLRFERGCKVVFLFLFRHAETDAASSRSQQGKPFVLCRHPSQRPQGSKALWDRSHPSTVALHRVAHGILNATLFVGAYGFGQFRTRKHKECFIDLSISNSQPTNVNNTHN